MGCTGGKEAPPPARKNPQPQAGAGKKPPTAAAAAAGGGARAPEKKAPAAAAAAPPPKGPKVTLPPSPFAPSPPENYKQSFPVWAPEEVFVDLDKVSHVREGVEPIFKSGSSPTMEFSGFAHTVVDFEKTAQPKLENTQRHAGPASPPSSNECGLASKLGINPALDRHLMYLVKALHTLPPPLGWEEVVDTQRDKRLFKKSYPPLPPGSPLPPAAEMLLRRRAQVEHPMYRHYLYLVHEGKFPPKTPGTMWLEGAKPEVKPSTFTRPVRLYLAEPAKTGKGANPWIDPAARDFNSEFQDLWDTTPLQPGALRDREVALMTLLDDFETEALNAAVTFVLETAVGDRNNTLRVGNLLLSYQNSAKHIHFYGSRSNAVKMHQHEFQGYHCVLSAYLAKLHVPLHATICFLGNRVTVVAALPLSKTSLVLGPSDPNASPETRKYAQGGEAESLLEIMAADYRLAKHVTPSMETIKVGSAMTECHAGSDKRLYVTQVSRTLPSCPVLLVDSFEFRPELVKTYRENKGLSTYWQNPEDGIVHQLQTYVNEETVEFYSVWVCSPAGIEGVKDGDDWADSFHHFGLKMSKLRLVHDKIASKQDISDRLKENRLYSLRNEMFARGFKAALREADDPSECFTLFMEDTAVFLAPFTKRKYDWDPMTVFSSAQEMDIKLLPDQEAILARVAPMMDSHIQTRRDHEGNLRITEVDLSQKALVKERSPKHCQNVFTFTKGASRFRPEIMRELDRNQTSTHISSDAMTEEALEGDLSNDMANVGNLLESVLLGRVIPKFASDLLIRPPGDQDMLANLAHEKGINMRFLGVVLFHIMQWKDDGDWRTVRDPDTNIPLAVEVVIIEMYSRTFLDFFEDKVQGHSYTGATLKAKACFQSLIDDPQFLTPRMNRKFGGGPGSVKMPPADKLVKRCSELCGALIVMADETSVAEVALSPVVKTVHLPPHLRCKWLADSENAVDMQVLPAIEMSLVDRVDARPDGTSAIPLLAMLSLLYQRWEEEEPGTRQQQLLDRRVQIAEQTDPASIEHGDANLLLGDYYKYLEDHKQAARYYTAAYSVLKKKVGDSQETLEAVLGLASVLRIAGEEKAAMEWFETARAIASKLTGAVADAKMIEIDTVTAECFVEECRYNEAVTAFTKAINLTEKTLGPEEETLAHLLEQRARANYSMNKYKESVSDFERAIDVYRKHQGDCVEVADIAVCLGQIETHGDDIRKAREHFELALQIYKAKYGPVNDHVKLIMQEHLAPCYEKIGLISQYRKCQLELMLSEGSDECSDNVALKYYEIAQAYKEENRREQAIKYFQLALIAHRKCYGDEHKYTKTCLDWLESLGGSDPGLPSARSTMGYENCSPRGPRVPRLSLPDLNGDAAHLRIADPQQFSSRSAYYTSTQHQHQQDPLHMNSHRGGPPAGVQPLLSASYNGTQLSYRSSDGNAPPGSPSFVKNEPRTVRSILTRAGMSSLDNLPMAAHHDAHDGSTSTEWD